MDLSIVPRPRRPAGFRSDRCETRSRLEASHLEPSVGSRRHVTHRDDSRHALTDTGVCSRERLHELAAASVPAQCVDKLGAQALPAMITPCETLKLRKTAISRKCRGRESPNIPAYRSFTIG